MRWSRNPFKTSVFGPLADQFGISPRINEIIWKFPPQSPCYRTVTTFKITISSCYCFSVWPCRNIMCFAQNNCSLRSEDYTLHSTHYSTQSPYNRVKLLRHALFFIWQECWENCLNISSRVQIRPHRARLVHLEEFLAPALLCHKEPARASKAPY